MLSKGQVIGLLAVLTLILAYGYGLSQEKAEKVHLIKDTFPELTDIVRLDEETFQYQDDGGNHYLVVEREQGWGGPMDVAMLISESGQIERLTILRHCETPSFLNRLYRDKYLEQYTHKEASSPFSVAMDIDAVSGATISSKAVARAVQKGSHTTARHYLGMTVADVPEQPSFGIKEIIASSLFLFVFLGGLFKSNKLRRLTLLSGLGILGFYASFPLSVSHLASLFLGRIPPLDSHLFTWIILLGTGGLLLLFGKNMYCSWICPFGALQELFSYISGIKMDIHPKVARVAKLLPGFFTWVALMVIFMYRNPSRGNYEPFGAIFSFEGQGLIWLILPFVIIVSFFIPRFWCRFFCPAGHLLNKAVKIRNRVVTTRRNYEK